ncbi:aquaporin [Candidatus Halocynthiibacter alkanivorans]|uniref:aquaporin n=1 Tax=Candidatus Halocynthiibacter alkanivorans TaxID=2267619 RepID=UPI001F2A8316|nr:MIP/aquaporin family protein [Candidatus Halocynthiibacter alkanivorans]
MSIAPQPTANRLLAEFLGTAFLLIGVVGSGIMAQELSGGNTGLALLANAIATGCILYVLITILGPVSGAHFNPVVTMVFTLRGEHAPGLALPYVAVQLLGGVLGVWATHAMFDLDILQFSTTSRSGTGQWWSEVIATFGLVLVIFGGLRHRPDAVPPLVGLYITGAYWFTSSTSFANPAVTVARALSDTFAGIHPSDVLMFILMQIIGALIATVVTARLFARAP